MVEKEIITPEIIVTITEVYFGRRPKRVSFFFPTLDPMRSPRKAMTPPMIINTRNMEMPINIEPPSYPAGMQVVRKRSGIRNALKIF